MLKNSLFIALVLAAFILPHGAGAASSVTPEYCPPVSFSASPNSGVSPLSVRLTIDARAFLTCAMGLAQEGDTKVSVAYTVSTGSGTTYNDYPPSLYYWEFGNSDTWIANYGIYSVDHTYSPGGASFLAQGQADFSIVTNPNRTLFAASSWADTTVTTSHPLVSVNLKVDGFDSSISKTVGSTANAGWDSTGADICRSSVETGQTVSNWSGNLEQTVPSGSRDVGPFNAVDSYKLVLSCSNAAGTETKDSVWVGTSQAAATLKVESTGVSGVLISDSGSKFDLRIGGTTNYSIVKTDGNINGSVDAPNDWSGYKFSGWSGCSPSNGQRCKVSVSSGETKTITANYNAEQDATLRVKSGGVGGVLITQKSGPSDKNGIRDGYTTFARTYSSNTSTTWEAPASWGGYNFSSWSGCGSTNNRECIVSINTGQIKDITANYGAAQPESGTPDMEIQGSITLTPSEPKTGDRVTFDAAAYNRGNAPAGNTSSTRLLIDVNDDGDARVWDVILDETTGNLQPGESENERWFNAWTAVAGRHRIWACADGSGVIAESIETNNCAEKRITVTGPPPPPANNPPSAVNLNVSPGSICTSPLQPTLSWTFSDSDSGDSQTAYQIQVKREGKGYGESEVSTGKINSSSNSYAVPAGFLQFNTAYNWRVKVWDESDAASEWADGPNFTTQKHAAPDVDFSWAPTNPLTNQTTQFADQSTVFGGASIASWLWSFQNGNPASSAIQNPQTKFTSQGTKTATLSVTDSDALQCAASKNVEVGLPPPEFKEVTP